MFIEVINQSIDVIEVVFGIRPLKVGTLKLTPRKYHCVHQMARFIVLSHRSEIRREISCFLFHIVLIRVLVINDAVVFIVKIESRRPNVNVIISVGKDVIVLPRSLLRMPDHLEFLLVKPVLFVLPVDSPEEKPVETHLQII